MIFINFSHPLSDVHLAHITELTGAEPERILNAMPHFDEQQPFEPQLTDLMAQFDLTATQW